MLSVIITVSLNDGTVQYQSSDEAVVSVAGTAAGTRLNLLPTANDSDFTLTFSAGADIDSLNSLTTPASAFGGSPLVPDANGIIVMTCNVTPDFYNTAFHTELEYTAAGARLRHDPTIVFNPPSGGTPVQLAEAPVAAEPVIV